MDLLTRGTDDSECIILGCAKLQFSIAVVIDVADIAPLAPAQHIAVLFDSVCWRKFAARIVSRRPIE